MIDQQTAVRAAVYSGQLAFQARLFDQAFEQLDDQIALRRPGPHSNHLNWLLGHIVHSRYMLMGMLGKDIPNPFGQQYQDAIGEGPYPDLQAIRDQFQVVHPLLLAQVDGLTEAALSEKPAPDQPSMAELISFFVFHEAYHLGQVGYLIKFLGLEPMKSH